jgi:hypothetical protein
MYWADNTLGVAKIRDTLHEWHGKYGGHWKPAKLIDDLAAAGKAFSDV